MKNQKTNNRSLVSKITARVMLVVLLLTSALNFSGCLNRGVEAGFYLHHSTTNRVRIAYKTDKKKFDINDVTLTFYFGSVEGIQFSSIQIYIEDDEGDIFLLKNIEINNPEDYVITYKKELGGLRNRAEFSHGEQITIPKEILIKSTYLSFWVASEEWDNGETGVRSHFMSVVGFVCERDGDTIIILD